MPQLDNIPEDLLPSIASLKNDSRFKGFLDFINDQGIKCATDSTKLDGTKSHWKQGASQALLELVEQIFESRDTLDKVENRKKQGANR